MNESLIGELESLKKTGAEEETTGGRIFNAAMRIAIATVKKHQIIKHNKSLEFDETGGCMGDASPRKDEEGKVATNGDGNIASTYVGTPFSANYTILGRTLEERVATIESVLMDCGLLGNITFSNKDRDI